MFLYIFYFELRDHNVNTSFIGMYCVILPTAKVILIFLIFSLTTFLFVFISVTQLKIFLLANKYLLTHKILSKELQVRSMVLSLQKIKLSKFSMVSVFSNMLCGKKQKREMPEINKRHSKLENTHC